MQETPVNVIFDMDGTLSDTAKATVKACNLVAAGMGLPPLDGITVRRAIGYACPEFFFRLLPGMDDEVVMEFGRQVEDMEVELVRELGPAILFDGVPELLEKIKEMGLPMHIASTGSPAHVSNTLSASGIKGYFTSISCGRPGKVGMVGDIMAGGFGGRFLMLGDKQKDAEAARGNGILAVGAAYGYCEPAEYHLFDAVIHHPPDLLAVIEGLETTRKGEHLCM